MNSRIKILIADDHPLFRQGLRKTLEAESAFRIVQEAGDGPSALRGILELKPNLCILDIQMPGLDGLEVVRQMRAKHSPTEVILLTMYKEEDLLNAALDLGVKGYVLKESAVDDVVESVRSVSRGQHYLSPALSAFLVRRRAGAEALQNAKPGLQRLTPAECRILTLIAQDKTSKEIADELGLSPRTVENHRSNICAKLDVHGIHSLVKFAYGNKSRL